MSSKSSHADTRARRATQPVDWYTHNPMTTADRRLSTRKGAWTRSFGCEDVRPLIVCRGPIRKETMDVLEQMGITRFGILLSEKDSIVYTHALAPELRRHPAERTHLVKDYTGATKAERVERVAEIVAICHRAGYTHVFAGYGFMAEDADFVAALEAAGLVFIGPRSSVQLAAGHKDEAKATALRESVSVTPGISDATVRTLLRKVGGGAGLGAGLGACAEAHGLAVDVPALLAEHGEHGAAEAVLEASYARGCDLFSIDELTDELVRCVAELFAQHPAHRVRLKAIGGGGGKGQRILDAAGPGAGPEEVAAAAAKAAKAAREILAEVKAGGVGDNKNILAELNIEETRHNEIQLVGNGEWCLALGGRDCSLQMHEQKLLEVSITQEELSLAVSGLRAEGRVDAANALAQDLETLRRMEAEAERFGLAVGLNSVSTFECIVEGPRHYFMEVNTRIQVEHRVTELCYTLRFTNPDDPHEHFDVTSLVEAMVLIARHGARLPRPTRVLREGAAVEARLNATDGALAPHAGGLILSWSEPIAHELRDDQGICAKNPDTGQFVRYRLAGAYDSNVALLVTYGADRHESYARLDEILRRTRLRGQDLRTNLEFHFGLLHWFKARDVYARPTTRFVVPYLTLVGELATEAARLDLQQLWAAIGRAWAARVPKGDSAAQTELRRILQLKETLVVRPVEALFAEPHIFSAWLSAHAKDVQVDDGRVRWLSNPLEVLRDTYRLLAMDYDPAAPAAHVIWDHDQATLEAGLRFYTELRARLGAPQLPWPELRRLLGAAEAPPGFDDALWARVRAAHAGHQCGLELLEVLPLIAARSGFFDLGLAPDLGVVIPPRLLDPGHQAAMRRALSPPPEESPDEIVAVSGGMFYAQEAPDKPPFISRGQRFKVGDPLYMIEVMKMFNTVYARFSGTVEEILVTGGDGAIVRRGQPLFRVRPDAEFAPVSRDAVEAERRSATQSYVAALSAP